jgi:hypothetical protein
VAETSSEVKNTGWKYLWYSSWSLCYAYYIRDTLN